MGNNYGNLDSYDYYQYEPFIPIFFTPKDEESKKEESELYSSDSLTRKSTLDEEENEKKIEFKKKFKLERDDKFKKIFKKLENSPIFEFKDSLSKYDENDYYLNFEENDNIRKSYYSKLIYKNIWTPGMKAKSHNSIFIFDWDDTILPTTFLTQEDIINDEYLPEEFAEIFSILEKNIIKVLELAINKGDVYIITNSSIGWVEFSAKKYFPNMAKILTKIKVISARSEYEDAYPGETKLWKEKAFLNLKKKIDLKLPSNIICFGDSIVELEAGKTLASKVNNSFIKTIKFQQNPEPEDLIKQIGLIIKKFDYIYSRAKNLSVRIDQKN
jgi:hypothetical protein